MAIDRTAFTAASADHDISIDFADDVKTAVDNLKANAVDITDGLINASEVTIDADATVNGDRSLILKLTASLSRLLKYKQSTGRMRLEDQAGALIGLEVADATQATQAATKGQMDAAIAASGFPGALGGPPPRYNDAASIIIPTGCRARNSTNDADIEAAGDLTVSLAASGANGLDTGSEANDTHYYVYLIRKSSDGTVAGLLSVTNEAVSGGITLPSGYDQKRQLPYSVRNDGSGNIIPTVITGGWPHRPHVQFRDYEESATYRVLNAGNQTSFTAMSLAALVPPISKMVDLDSDFIVGFNITSKANVRATGSGLTTGALLQSGYSDERQTVRTPGIITDANQSIDYKLTDASSGTSLTAWVPGYTVTEVN